MRARTALAAAGLLLTGGVVFLPVTGSGTPAAAADACGAIPGTFTGTLTGAAVRVPITGTYTVTSEYGMRSNPTNAVYQLHAGIDLATSAPVPIVAMTAGTVTFAGYAGTAGNMVVIDHGNAITTRSMHMSALTVRQGQVVAAGQQVGVEGTTGDSTGMHLHFEVLIGGVATDPRPWLARAGVTLPALGGWSGAPGSPGGAVSAGAGGQVPSCDPAGSGLNADAVPAAFRPWVLKAGTICATFTPAVIAATIETESGWNPRAVSAAGAQGPSQFMPGTWPAWGRDDDGNGTASPFDIGDALMAQARYDCAIAASLDGLVPGNLLDLALAGYNAGPGAVKLYGGIPPYAETQAYVQRIKTLAATRYAAVTTPSRS